MYGFLVVESPYGELYLYTRNRAYHSCSWKNRRTQYGRSMARRSTLRNGCEAQPPDFRTYSPKVTSFPSNLPVHRIVRARAWLALPRGLAYDTKSSRRCQEKFFRFSRNFLFFFVKVVMKWNNSSFATISCASHAPKNRRTAAAESKNMTKSAQSAAGMVYRVLVMPAAPQ